MDTPPIFNKSSIEQMTRVADPIGTTLKQVLAHSARTSVTAAVSLLVARLLRLPQSYWAPLTTIVITQSSLSTTLAVSWQRFLGNALGAAAGGILASYFSLPYSSSRTIAFLAGLFLLGLLCALARADRSAYRFGGVTVAVVLLIPGAEPPWQIALHRFGEVSIGIAVALLMTLVWPETKAIKPGLKPDNV